MASPLLDESRSSASDRLDVNPTLNLFHHNGGPHEGRAYVPQGRTWQLRRNEPTLYFSANRSSAKHGHDLSAADRMESQIEADDRRRRVCGNIELLDVKCVHRMDVSMRGVAGWRRSAGVASCTGVIAQLQDAFGQSVGTFGTGTGREPVHVSRDIHREPVPETTARGRVGVVHGDGEALRLGGKAAPR